MGSLTHVKDEVHSARIGIGLDTTLQDVTPEAFNEIGRRLQAELAAVPGVTGLDTTLQDVRYAFRGLRRSLHFEAGAG
jgi:hypothetical protein